MAPEASVSVLVTHVCRSQRLRLLGLLRFDSGRGPEGLEGPEGPGGQRLPPAGVVAESWKDINISNGINEVQTGLDPRKWGPGVHPTFRRPQYPCSGFGVGGHCLVPPDEAEQRAL